MTLGIQLIGLLFGIFMLYLTHLYFKKKTFTKKELFVWSALWLSFLALITFPNFTNIVLESLSITRALDLFIISGFMISISITFYVYIVLRREQKRVQQIIEKLALKDIDW